MKRVLSWAVVGAVTIIISVLLFVTGKQHKVMLINGADGAEVPARVSYIVDGENADKPKSISCLLYTSPSPRDRQKSRMPSSA